jgi:hypothetical protein
MAEGTLPRYHPLLLLIEVAVIMLSGMQYLSQYKWHLWCRPLFDLCESLFTIAGGAAYRLFLGRPEGFVGDEDNNQTVLDAANCNFMGPSVRTLHNYKLAVQYENGLLTDNVELFRDIMLSANPPAVGFQDAQCKVVFANLQADETPVAPGAFVLPGQSCLGGFWPIPTLAEIKQKLSGAVSELTKWLKSLVGLTEVLEFHLQDLECRFHLNVGRYFQTKTGGGPKVLGNITDMVKGVQTCDCCRAAKVQGCTAFCSECMEHKSVCADCKQVGYTEYHYLKRACHECRAHNRPCRRIAVIAVSTDGASENSAAANLVEQAVADGTILTPLLFLFDSSHFGKNFRNSLANWRLKLGRSRNSLAHIVGLRACNDQKVAQALAAAVSTSALEYKNRLSVQYITEVFREGVEKVLRSTSRAVFTLVPEKLRPFAVNKESIQHGAVGNPRSITVDYIGRLYIATPKTLVMAVQSNPLKLLSLTGTADSPFEQVQGLCMLAKDTLLIADKGGLFCLRGLNSVPHSPGKKDLASLKPVSVKLEPQLNKELTAIAAVDDETVAISSGNAVYLYKLSLSANKRTGEKVCRITGFNRPVGVAFDTGTKELFVTDHRGLHRCIQSENKEWKTELISGDFVRAKGVAVRRSGTVVVADADACCLKLVERHGAGWRSTLFAGTVDKRGSDDGPWQSATFAQPHALCCEDDTVYVCQDNAVREVADLLPLAELVGHMRTMLEAFGILDRARRDDPIYRKLKEIQLDTVIERLGPVNDYLQSVVQARVDLFGTNKVEGPDGTFYFNSVRRFAETFAGLKTLHETLAAVSPETAKRLRIASLSTEVAEHWFGLVRATGQDRVPGAGAYMRKTGVFTKESIKKACQLGFNYTTNVIPYYQAPAVSTTLFSTLKLRYRKDVKIKKLDRSTEDWRALRTVAQMLKPSATAAPMDKYRKPAGVAVTVMAAETKVERQLRREEQKGDQKMVDVNRAPAPGKAQVVQPPKRTRKRRVDANSVDPELLAMTDLMAQGDESDLDAITAAAQVRSEEPEFENDSEDDDSDYKIR